MKNILVGLLMLIGGAARAEVPDWSTGPSLAFARFGFDSKPGSSDPSLNVLRAGAGWTLRRNLSMRSPDGQVAYLSLDGTLLADLGTLPTSGGMSVAVGPSFYNGLFGVQVGYKLFSVVDGAPTEGLFTLDGGKRNLFFLLSISINLATGMPQLTPSTAAGAAPAPTHLPPNYFHL